MHKQSFFQRNWYFFAPIAIIVIPLLMAVSSALTWGYGFSESMTALLHCVSSDTRYAVKFSEDKFHRIEPGLRGDQVFNLIGVPFQGQNGLSWDYSLPQGNTKYFHQRTVIFDKDAQGVPHVKELISRFHTPETKP